MILSSTSRFVFERASLIDFYTAKEQFFMQQKSSLITIDDFQKEISSQAPRIIFNLLCIKSNAEIRQSEINMSRT
jgi:hypothetical protein